MANKIYALVGPHASGKSALVKRLIELGVHFIPGVTTRIPTKLDTQREIFRFVDKTDLISLSRQRTRAIITACSKRTC